MSRPPWNPNDPQQASASTVETLALEQLASTRFGSADGTVALNLIVALAREIEDLKARTPYP